MKSFKVPMKAVVVAFFAFNKNGSFAGGDSNNPDGIPEINSMH